MFRSLFSIMLLAHLGGATDPATISETSRVSDAFDMVNLLTVNPIPVKDSFAVAPVVEASAALLMDAGTGTVLFEKNADIPLPMASLTKIMTAFIILEDHDPDEVVTVQSDFRSLEGVRMWLQQYEKITVADLLAGLLIPSAGDAAIALAEHHSGTVEAFVEKMNQKAVTLGMKHTHFVNPIGLDAPNHYSSARDMAIITRYAMRLPLFRQLVGTDSLVVSSVSGNISHELNNTNALLDSYLDVRGVKTGTTDDAGQSVVNLVRGSQRQEVISVLLNSPSRFQESKSMLDWALRNYRW